jgi:hypothetical protein
MVPTNIITIILVVLIVLVLLAASIVWIRHLRTPKVVSGGDDSEISLLQRAQLNIVKHDPSRSGWLLLGSGREEESRGRLRQLRVQADSMGLKTQDFEAAPGGVAVLFYNPNTINSDDLRQLGTGSWKQRTAAGNKALGRILGYSYPGFTPRGKEHLRVGFIAGFSANRKRIGGGPLIGEFVPLGGDGKLLSRARDMATAIKKGGLGDPRTRIWVSVRTESATELKRPQWFLDV